ncbi:MAG: 30S ribosomal protein S20 [bacterium]|nr:30S ribosomal protein S20 [bacterium]
MPITVGAIRKQRADKRRVVVNLRVKNLYKNAVKKMRQKPNAKALTEAFSRLDRAAKTHVIHKNKAARLKSRLSKLLAKSASKNPAPKAAKKK